MNNEDTHHSKTPLAEPHDPAERAFGAKKLLGHLDPEHDLRTAPVRVAGR